MIRIEKDGVYKAKRVRWGENDHGKWELVVVASDKGKQEITIFPENVPCGVKEDARRGLYQPASGSRPVRRDQR